ncbi:MAG: hypothetical protein COA66_13860 [Arcobacter sp.]|nr:MAG: hypothetical protein COA66_13860 [Arcobacter sp.]
MSKIIKPMSNTELFQAAKSIFSNSASQSVSAQYHFVKTSEILDIFREAGYFPILAGEAKSRSIDGQPYVKHLIQFRSLENLLKAPKNGLYYDICLKNSHNKTSSFSLDLSCFRIVCMNLLTVSTDQLMYRRIIHKGFQNSKITRAINEIVNYIPTVEKQIEQMKQITLTDIESLALSKAVIDIRFDSSKHDVNPKELLKIKRKEDSFPSSFNIYNRLQESVINGGIKLKSKTSQKITTSKAVTSIDEKIRINKELYKTVQNLILFKQESEYQLEA